MDELGIHAFEIRQHEKLLDAGVVSHVAVERGIGLAPLLGGLTKEGNVEQVGLVGIDHGRLGGGDGRRDDVGFDGVGVYAVVELGKSAVQIPGEREAAAFVVFKALEFLDEVKLELGRYPRGKFESNFLMGKGAAVTSRF